MATKEFTKDSKPEKVKFLTYGKARELYLGLKDLPFDGVPQDRVGAFLLLVAGLTGVVEGLDAKLTAIQNKKPKELELSDADVDTLNSDETAQLKYSLAKSNWESSLNETIKTLFAEPTTIPLDECKLLTKEQFESLIQANKKKVTMQSSVILFTHLIKD